VDVLDSDFPTYPLRQPRPLDPSRTATRTPLRQAMAQPAPSHAPTGHGRRCPQRSAGPEAGAAARKPRPAAHTPWKRGPVPCHCRFLSYRSRRGPHHPLLTTASAAAHSGFPHHPERPATFRFLGICAVHSAEPGRPKAYLPRPSGVSLLPSNPVFLTFHSKSQKFRNSPRKGR